MNTYLLLTLILFATAFIEPALNQLVDWDMGEIPSAIILEYQSGLKVAHHQRGFISVPFCESAFSRANMIFVFSHCKEDPRQYAMDKEVFGYKYFQDNQWTLWKDIHPFKESVR